VFALLAVFLWGSNAVIARHLALEGVSMSVVAFLRVAVGSVVLGGWLAATTPASLHRCSLLLRNRWVGLAVLCYGGNMLVFHWALRYTTASSVMMLENIAPVVALFGGAWFFRERITWRAITALCLALVGVWLVCTADAGLVTVPHTTVALGNCLALLAGLTWGGYTIACRGQGRSDASGQDALTAMAVMLLGSAVLLVPLLVGTHGWPHTPGAWLWILVLAVFHTATATVLWRLALSHISAYIASLLFLLTIVLTMGNAVIFLHERITGMMLLGAGGIVAALLTVIGKSTVRISTEQAVKRDTENN
ncbi:MAG TPA: DMT family transporter, partial [Armatimonadota bacterium]|nr:DMT family transporter [Armatimonadota bacterium]